MSVKDHQVWVCRECGEETRNWSGKCPNCAAWNTLQVFRLSKGKGNGRSQPSTPPIPVRIDDPTSGTDPADRRSTGSVEFDRVLGGGPPRSATLLLSGEPGVGKSTLLLQVAHEVADLGESVLYVTGEEAVDQIQQRSRRLRSAATSSFQLVAAHDVDDILTVLDDLRPSFIILDSIQTVSDRSYPSLAGSVLQVRQVTARLSEWVKTQRAILLMIGHVTKSGQLAGPRTLEHLVDVVLSLEGNRHQSLRILRSQKNRYGPTDEIGLLTMAAGGLEDLSDPSELFMREYQSVPGSATALSLEGQRALPIGVEALVRPTHLPYPKRLTNGIPVSRLELVIAVLEAHAGVTFGADDCFVALSGGLKLRDPALDLPIAAALVSAKYRLPLPEKFALFGELGLTGSVRPIADAKKRSEEAVRLGFKTLGDAPTIREALLTLGLTRKGRVR